MRTVNTVLALRAAVAAARAGGARIALVPTMGNLHAGHLKLVDVAKQHADFVVASVFVNPLQFGPSEDFDRYPRTLSADTEALAGAGCDVLFAPPVEAMIPPGVPTTRVSVPDVAEGLEGTQRPGHFDGVSTIVSILFHQVQPDVACFGQKDYQQLAVVRRMVADLHLPVEIIGVPTERAGDGLALSSRNQYLDEDARRVAPMLFHTLQSIGEALRGGALPDSVLEADAMHRLRAAGFEPEYVAIRAPDLGDPTNGPWVVLAAARLGATRLIDNLLIENK
jgi:pantoate--beta-alanine ligase